MPILGFGGCVILLGTWGENLVRRHWLSSTLKQQVTLVNLTDLSKAPPPWSHVWAVTHTHTNTGRQTYSIQTEMTGVTKSKRGSAGTAEKRWQIQREKQSEVTMSHLHQGFDCSQNQWQLCSLTNSTTLHHPTLLPRALTLGVRLSHHD